MMLATAEALAYQNSVSLGTNLANSSSVPVSSSSVEDSGANIANGGAVELLQKVVRPFLMFRLIWYFILYVWVIFEQKNGSHDIQDP